MSLWHRCAEENRKRVEGKSGVFSFISWCADPFPYFCPPSLFMADLEKKVAEATSAADALKKSLDAEVSERSALEAVFASACEGLGVEASALGSSLWSRVGALYS